MLENLLNLDNGQKVSLKFFDESFREEIKKKTIERKTEYLLEIEDGPKKIERKKE